MDLVSTCPSGKTVTFSFTDDSPILNVNASARFANGKAALSFQLGRRGYFESACTDMIKSTLQSRSVLKDLELLVAVGDHGLVTTAGLRGPHHDVIAVIGGPPIEAAQAALAFADFTVSDTATGMTMKPTRSDSVLIAEDTTVIVEGRGVLTALVGKGALAALPAWQGTPTRYGEVWRRKLDLSPDDEATGYEYFVGFDTVAAQLTPGSFGDDSSADWAEWLYELKLEAA
ncbi:MAG TPA: hypothetical protein VFV89_12100 [Nocardioides sp.]|uniref:hypothetical protein n=1 Tax=Nocardioides sp. TaxID=35761 RepID=UPI002E308051|nr:hypothetical protein [Nocardioides sp.]HEX5088542.1 hypothetical protein [Nocardioides sp.]